VNTVLFVDDSSDLCEVMELMCQSLPGIECICVPSMSAVLERPAQVLRTDLAILDVNLGPGDPSGVEIYRWLKGQNYHGKIVFLSGHARRIPRSRKQQGSPTLIFSKSPWASVKSRH
jgi:CheY-like chemotaxis protein